MNFEDQALSDSEEDCGNYLYKGVHKPRCNKGLGCVACWEIYFGGQSDRQREKEEELKGEGD